MSEQANDEGHLRKYLLGELDEADQQAFEERLMTETELFALLPVVEDELIEDYLGELLSSDERGRFESLFVSTAERRRKLSFAMAFRRYITTEGAESETALAASAPHVTPSSSSILGNRSPWWRQAFSTPYLRLAAATVIVIGIGFGIWRASFYQSELDKGGAALAQAYRYERPIEARISGLDYAPLSNQRGGGQGKIDALSLNRAERILLDEVYKHPTPQARHALARLYVAKKEYLEAIDQFERALGEDPNNALLHSDYGAALLEKGKAVRNEGDSGKSPEDFAKSLYHLNRALALDPSLNQSLFNRALLHEQMMLKERAGEDWRAYLEKDPASNWAEEAREHLDRLKEGRTAQNQKNLIEDFLTACRLGDAEEVWELFTPNRQKLSTELVEIYVRCAIGGPQNKCREALDVLRYAGDLDAGRTGDLYATNVASFYGSASRLQLLAANQAQKLMRQARALYDASKLNEGIAAYERARNLFKQAGDVCGAQLATFWLGLCYWELTQTQLSRELWSALQEQCKADGHRWLQARTLNMLSGVAFKHDEYSRAIRYSTDAGKLAGEVNDVSGAFSANSALIEYYRLLGNRAECMTQIEHGLPVLENVSIGSIARWRYYDIVAMAHNTFGQYDAAIDYEREALTFAVDSGDFVQIAVSHANLGLMCGKAQNFESAFKHAAQAYAIAAAHASEVAGQLHMALASVTTGHLYRERREFHQALASYDQTVELHRANNLDFSVHLYQAYRGRLVCYMALSDTAAAQGQLAILLDVLDKHRATIIEEENRNEFFAVEQSVYDLAIDLAYSQLHNWQQAFANAEASRARSLLDSIKAGVKVVNREGKVDLLTRPGATPLPIADIQARIPAEGRLLYYALLDNKLLIWVVSRTDFDVPVEVKVSQSALSDSVMEFNSSLRGSSDADPEASERLARQLYEQLIEPVQSLIGDSHKLYIIPDKVLFSLPWDALMSPAGRFIVQDYVVTLSPSATLFAACTAWADEKSGVSVERLESVGDPSFDRDAFPKLNPLPEAAHEAQDIAGLYELKSLLLGPSAREQDVRNELMKADVAHFALHCVINDRSSARSALVLAKESSSGRNLEAADGLLQAYEIYDIKLPRTRLVLLSACQSGVERYYRGEGMVGMARAFLVAHVPLVVASLWAVDSRATEELMIRFHEYRRHGRLSTDEALRRAKCDLLHNSQERYRQPTFWAAFQAIGGFANF